MNFEEEIMYEVARNESTPLEILEELSLSDSYLVRLAVVKNENLPGHLLDKIARRELSNNSYGILAIIARHKNILIDTLAFLAESGPRELLYHLAVNECLGYPGVLQMLSEESEDEEVLKSVARNKYTSKEVLSELIRRPVIKKVYKMAPTDSEYKNMRSELKMDFIGEDLRGFTAIKSFYDEANFKDIQGKNCLKCNEFNEYISSDNGEYICYNCRNI